MIKLCDLVNILKPNTRICFNIEIKGDRLVIESTLSNFLKSRYFTLYFNESVEFSLSGGLCKGYVAEITVQGGLYE